MALDVSLDASVSPAEKSARKDEGTVDLNRIISGLVPRKS
jgi:hypothetical protein